MGFSRRPITIFKSNWIGTGPYQVFAKLSEINANPRDTKDYTESVGALPLGLAIGEKDYEKYASIGESDRMTLKFVKPLKK